MLTTVELTIRRLPDDSLGADAWHTSATSAATATLAANIPVALDQAALNAHILDPVAYGRELSAQLFADPRLRHTWLKARAYAADDTLQLGPSTGFVL